MRSMRKALLLCISFNTLCFALLPSLRTFMPLLLLTSVFAGFRNASDSLNMTWIVSELEQKKKQGISSTTAAYASGDRLDIPSPALCSTCS